MAWVFRGFDDLIKCTILSIDETLTIQWRSYTRSYKVSKPEKGEYINEMICSICNVFICHLDNTSSFYLIFYQMVILDGHL